MAEESGGVTPDTRAPIGLVLGTTPGPMRTETCYLCDKPVAVSVAAVEAMAIVARETQYAHSVCHVEVIRKIREVHGAGAQ